jgi:hypothetical protein
VQAAAAAAAAACAPPPVAEEPQTPEHHTSESQQNSDDVIAPSATLDSSHDIASTIEEPQSRASAMEDWINAEFGYLEPLDEVREFPEFMQQVEFSCFSELPLNFHDELPHSSVNSPPSDAEDQALYDHNLWCFS